MQYANMDYELCWFCNQVSLGDQSTKLEYKACDIRYLHASRT